MNIERRRKSNTSYYGLSNWNDRRKMQIEIDDSQLASTLIEILQREACEAIGLGCFEDALELLNLAADIGAAVDVWLFDIQKAIDDRVKEAEEEAKCSVQQ